MTDERGPLQILTIPEAARLIGVSRSRMWQFARARRIPAERVGRLWVIRRDDLEQFARQARVRGRPAAVKRDPIEDEGA